MEKVRGRPRLIKTKALRTFLSVRMRPPEIKEVLAAVEGSGKSQSEWIRDSLLAAARAAKQ